MGIIAEKMCIPQEEFHSFEGCEGEAYLEKTANLISAKCFVSL